MSKIFYHGSNRLFDKFDNEFAVTRSGNKEIFVSPCHCKSNSMSYITREGGYLYTIEIDDSNNNFRLSKEWGNDNCQCRAYSDLSGFRILKVEKVEYDGKPVFVTECGSIAMITVRKIFRPQTYEAIELKLDPKEIKSYLIKKKDRLN